MTIFKRFAAGEVQDAGGGSKRSMMKWLLPIALLAVLAISAQQLVGVNDAGHRTVVQYLNGTLVVKFEPGWYLKLFGKTTVYNDVLTFDFDKLESQGDGASIDQKGVAVRYQDGGTGTIYGKARFSLPHDEKTMLKLHKDFRSNEGVSYKLIKVVTEEAENLTAGLMTSEEAYATKRGIFTQMSHEQISKGKYQTELKESIVEDEATGKRIVKVYPEIKYGQDGRVMMVKSDLLDYGITLTGYQITDWDFEGKTLEQIAAKRQATMAIITAKANAERARQDAITAEEQGKANVVTAQYEKEVEKERAIVAAQQAKEVATIAAEQQVAVAMQQRIEAEQKKLAAVEYKQEQTLRGEGDAAYKRLVMQADGALAQKLATYEAVMGKFATEFGKQKWVPEIAMGSASGTQVGQAAQFIELLTVKAAKDLQLNLKPE